MGILGSIVAKLIRDSVETAKQLQGMANANLARLEMRLLPESNFGWYCHLVSKDKVSRGFFRPDETYEKDKLNEIGHPNDKKGDTLYERLSLAKALLVIWNISIIVGVLLVVGAVCFALVPAWKQEVQAFASSMNR